MNMESRNQQNLRRSRSYYYDRENPSRTIILSSEVDDNSVYDLMEMICDINEYDDENEESIKDYDRKPIKIIINSFGGSVYDGFALIGVMEN